MHILMMLFGALAAIGVIIWRIQMAAHAARELGDMAKTAANLPRRLAFRRKSGKRGSRLVEDPREAAVILMLEIARAAGEISREQKNKINDIIVDQFQFTAEDAAELMVQASWVAQDEAGTDALHRRMAKLIQSKVSEAELIDLDFMLSEVSEAEGRPTPAQMDIIVTFRQITGIRT